MSACMLQKKLSASNPGNRLLEVTLPLSGLSGLGCNRISVLCDQSLPHYFPHFDIQFEVYLELGNIFFRNTTIVCVQSDAG